MILNKDVGVFTRKPKEQLASLEELFPMPAEMSGFKTSFRKAILFKVYYMQDAPNICLFERIFQKIEKIANDHHDELFVAGDNTWVLILTSMFKLA